MIEIFFLLLIASLIGPPILVVRFFQKRWKNRFREHLEAAITLPGEEKFIRIDEVLKQGFKPTLRDWAIMGLISIVAPAIVFAVVFEAFWNMGGFDFWYSAISVPFIILFVRVRQSSGSLGLSATMDELGHVTEQFMQEQDIFAVDAWFKMMNTRRTIFPNIDEYLVRWGSPAAYQLSTEDGKARNKWQQKRKEKENGVFGADVFAQGGSSLYRCLELCQQLIFFQRVFMAMEMGERTAQDIAAQYPDYPYIEFHLRELEHQLLAKRLHPNAVCRKCLQRSQEKYHQGVPIVICPECMDHRDLEIGVKNFVGEIGVTSEPLRNADIFHAELWDTETRKVRKAEVDAIYVKAGVPLNYDWAMAAVIEMIRNHYPEKVGSINIHIDPAVELSDNTQILLKEMGPVEKM